MNDARTLCQSRKLPENMLLFSGNMLKIIACVCMFADHTGIFLFPAFRYPEFAWLRFVGRLAFPIFAYLFAEGAFYTKNPKKHFLLIAGFAAVMQAAITIGTGIADFNVFVIFTASLLFIRLFDFSVFFRRKAKSERKLSDFACAIICPCIFCALFLFLAHACFCSGKLADMFGANYGFFGIVTPFFLYCFKKCCVFPIGSVGERLGMLSILSAGLLGIMADGGASYQWISFFSLPLLACYSGKRGKANLKYFFYLFYPLHVLLLVGVSLLIG